MRVSKFAGAEMDLLIALSERTPLWVEHLLRGSIVQKSNAEGRLDKCTDVTRLLDAKWATELLHRSSDLLISIFSKSRPT